MLHIFDSFPVSEYLRDYLEPSRSSKVELFCKNNLRLLAVYLISQKNSLVSVRLGSYASACSDSTITKTHLKVLEAALVFLLLTRDRYLRTRLSHSSYLSHFPEYKKATIIPISLPLHGPFRERLVFLS